MLGSLTSIIHTHRTGTGRSINWTSFKLFVDFYLSRNILLVSSRRSVVPSVVETLVKSVARRLLISYVTVWVLCLYAIGYQTAWRDTCVTSGAEARRCQTMPWHRWAEIWHRSAEGEFSGVFSRTTLKVWLVPLPMYFFSSPQLHHVGSRQFGTGLN